jgi:Uma2 family endonuclease
MTVTSAKKTLEGFLRYEDDTDFLYELENGELVAIPAESERMSALASNKRSGMYFPT